MQALRCEWTENKSKSQNAKYIIEKCEKNLAVNKKTTLVT